MTKEILGSTLNAMKEMVGLGFAIRVMEEMVEKSNSLVAVEIVGLLSALLGVEERGEHEEGLEVGPNCFFLSLHHK